MNSQWLLGGLLYMTTVSATAGYADQSAWSDTQKEVWGVVRAWNDAFETNDVERYFEYIAPEVVVMTPGSPYRVEFEGPDRREFEFGVEAGYGKIRFFQELGPRVDIFGETAVVTYYSRGLWGAEATQMVYLKETNVLVQRDGRWRIVHIHVSR